MEGMRRLSSGCHGRGSRALPRYDAPPAWRQPVSHVPAEQRVRERVVQDGHGEPVAMARTLLGARAGHGGRECLHGVPPSSRGAHRPRPAAGGQRRRGRWHRPCAFPILRQGQACRRASPCSRCNASGARCTRAPYACCPSSRWGGGPVGTCSRGRFPSRKRCGHGRRCASKEGEMERSGMRRPRCTGRRGGRSLSRGGLDDRSAERHRGPARRAGVR
jgi:hypothetical protein